MKSVGMCWTKGGRGSNEIHTPKIVDVLFFMVPGELLARVTAGRGAEVHHRHGGVQAEGGQDHIPRVVIGNGGVHPLGESVEAALQSVWHALKF